MRPKLSIIIVNYNVRNYLVHCLHSVARATENISVEIIVVDNASTDGDYQWISRMYPQVRWYGLPHNLGFGRANNIGIQEAAGQYVLFLNPDTLLPEDGLEKALAFFQTHTDCGALGVHMMDGKGNFLPESKRSLPTPLVSFCKLSGLSAIFPHSKFFGKYALTYLPDDKNWQVPVLAGAFMMVRSDLLHTAGGFDENFFMYGEDIDLSYRLQNRTGFRNYFLGEVSILHFKGESSKQDRAQHNRVFYEAMVIFVKKYYKGLGGWWMRTCLNAAMKLQQIAGRFKPSDRSGQEPKLGRYATYGDATAQESVRAAIARHYPEAHRVELQSLTPPDSLIICIGKTYGYKDAFTLLKSPTLHAQVFWFDTDSRSIIGSNDKNRTGVAWPCD